MAAATAKTDFQMEAKGGPRGTRRMNFIAGESYDQKEYGIPDGHPAFDWGPAPKRTTARKLVEGNGGEG